MMATNISTIWVVVFLVLTSVVMAANVDSEVLQALTKDKEVPVIVIFEEGKEVSINDFEQRKSFGFRIINEYDHLNDSIAKQAQDLRKKRKLDGIMITDPNMDRDESANIKNLAEDLHVRFIYSADLLAAAAGNITIHTLAGCPMIELKKTRLEGWGKIYKRGFDILASILLLIITLPITIVVALTILIETGLPILFKNIMVR